MKKALFLILFHSTVVYSFYSAFTRVSAKNRVEMNGVMKGLASTSLVVSLAANSGAGPLGNLGAAWNSLKNDPQSVLCSLENQNIDDLHGSCQQLDRIVRYRAGKLLTIEQDWGSSASTGSAVWNGANMAAWYIEHGMNPRSLQGARVVELGAGVGFTSLVASALGATDVTITDGNVDVLALADKNIAQNVVTDRAAQVRTAQLRWGTDDEKPFLIHDASESHASDKRPIDFILVSDCTYKKAAWADLMGTVARLSTPGVTKTILSMEPRNIGEVLSSPLQSIILATHIYSPLIPIPTSFMRVSMYVYA